LQFEDNLNNAIKIDSRSWINKWSLRRSWWYNNYKLRL